MIGLALEGGGAKGSYQVGAYMALKKCHIKIDAVVGTSIGSLNGALIASHQEKRLVELWKDASMNELLGIDEEKAFKILKEGLTLENIKWSFAELYKIFKNKGLDMSSYRALVRNNVDESLVRNSNIRYGLTTIKLDKFTPLELFIEDIPNGKLHDYIVASSYLPVFKKEKIVDGAYYLDGGFYNLSPSDMLEKMGCTKIFVINIRGIGRRKKTNKREAEIIEIKPNGDLGSIILFDQKSILDNMRRGYLDTLKTLGKIDGIDYYFTKKTKWYYKRLNHKVDKDTYNLVKILLNGKDEKDIVVKALEYVMKREKFDELIKYKQSYIIKSIKGIKSDNAIYKYVKKLSIW